jgi:hypothetical protein
MKSFDRTAHAARPEFDVHLTEMPELCLTQATFLITPVPSTA